MGIGEHQGHRLRARGVRAPERPRPGELVVDLGAGRGLEPRLVEERRLGLDLVKRAADRVGMVGERRARGRGRHRQGYRTYRQAGLSKQDHASICLNV